jgi:hypothetical protein
LEKAPRCFAGDPAASSLRGDRLLILHDICRSYKSEFSAVEETTGRVAVANISHWSRSLDYPEVNANLQASRNPSSGQPKLLDQPTSARDLRHSSKP